MRASSTEPAPFGDRYHGCDCEHIKHISSKVLEITAGSTKPGSESGPVPAYAETAQREIESRGPELVELSSYLTENPELGYEEFKAHAKLTEYLSQEGFDVSGYPHMPTAFRASYTHGSGGRIFGLNSEYDALPAIGHACGHNLIAVSGIAALVAMRRAMQEHNLPGTVVLLGTPAEEGGGGKIKLLKAGAYEDLGACMMLHPGPGLPGQGGIGPSLARLRVVIDFHGKPAHAAAAPWEGLNALDAAVNAYVGISTLRQQLKPTTRIHGVISNGGGTAPNIIPARTQMIYAIRAETAGAVESTTKKIIDCVEGAARMAQCTVDMEFSDMYRDLVNDKALAYEYVSAMDQMYGYKVRTIFDPANGIGASTDFGN
ncbi:hypothetical protein I317_07828, partial [Kwoniella heveanensis CBS 569]